MDDYDDSYLREKVSDLESELRDLGVVVGSLLIGRRVSVGTDYRGGGAWCPGGEGLVQWLHGSELAIRMDDGRVVERKPSSVTLI